MTAFGVDAPVDAVLCLFSSIGYVHSVGELESTFRCFAAAVRPGGVVVVEPWLQPNDLIDGQPSARVHDSPDLKLCRMTVSKRRGDVAVLDMHWLVAVRDRPVEHFVERHEMWMPTRGVVLSAMTAAGLEARFEPEGLMPERGLYLGRRLSTGGQAGDVPLQASAGTDGSRVA